MASRIFLTLVTAPIDKTAEINYALVDDPTFTDAYILSRNKASLQQFYNKLIFLNENLINYGLILDFVEEFLPVPQGEFMSRAHPTEAPFSPPPLPGVSETNRMTYFWLSEYMANTAGYVYQKAGAFKHTLTPENVKVGPTGICYREVLYCIGPTV